MMIIENNKSKGVKMKLRNKKTGEIGNLVQRGCEDERIWVWIDNISKPAYRYNSLAELNEEWEDYEEPKEYYYISDFGAIRECEIGKFPEDEEDRKRIGNYFETEEEAEKAVEKLKAWTRLKDKGFRFDGYEIVEGNIHFIIDLRHLRPDDLFPDLDLLFGGEE